MSNYNFATHYEYLITEQNLTRIRVSEENFGQNKRFIKRCWQAEKNI